MPTTSSQTSTPLSRLLKRRTESDIVVEAEELAFAYPTSPGVLEGVNLSIKRGECVVIFGPNGGGKTTLFKLILGLIKPARGSLAVFGTAPENARNQIGYVPQKAPVDPLFPITVLDVVLQGALAHTTWWGHLPLIWKERSLALLKHMGLEPHLHKRFGSLSGGLAQRALLARALLPDPSLLLLDEPTAHVDAEAETAIYDLLLKLKGKTTILLITHNLAAVTPLADRLLCIRRTATPYAPSEVCAHFSAGLYHGVNSDVF